MDTCEVLVAGGGPAGSACAWRLRQAGLDVVVVDRAAFPRDKVCAGWITPQVLTELQIDTDEYRRGRTLQPITGFRTGIIGRRADLETRYDGAVSFGIRRCEFDHYLLLRSGARLKLGSSVSTIRRDGTHWIVNDEVRAPVLVGAGGHFCPVARSLNHATTRDRPSGAPLVVAQEVEFPVSAGESDAFATAPETPALYFSPDLKGYGWCFRKEGFVNIGFGRLESSGALPAATAEFVAFLQTKGTIPVRRSWPWRGHAYLLQPSPRRRVVGDGVVLVGDAAGLAYPQSGEGIRPAVESGLLAARTIIEARGQSGRGRLEPYEARLRSRLGLRQPSNPLSRLMPSGLAAALATRLLEMPVFVRHVVLDRWFLHVSDPPLVF